MGQGALAADSWDSLTSQSSRLVGSKFSEEPLKKKRKKKKERKTCGVTEEGDQRQFLTYRPHMHTCTHTAGEKIAIHHSITKR